MSSCERQYTIVLFGKEGAPKNVIGNYILENTVSFTNNTKTCEQKENKLYAVINTPDFFVQANCPEQFINHSEFSKTDVFLLVIQDGHETQLEVEEQLYNLQKHFGEQITDNMIVMLSQQKHIDVVKEEINKKMKFPVKDWIIYEDWQKIMMLSEHKKKCNSIQNMENFSVKKTDKHKTPRESDSGHAETSRHSTKHSSYEQDADSQACHRLQSDTKLQGQSICGKPSISCKTLNIVLLGQTGVGKSASGNTILKKRSFHSHASSMPVTKVCQVENMQITGTVVRVIDTPDFFDASIEEYNKQSNKPLIDCINVCRTGYCVYLLVIQIGRFTDAERGILAKFENAFDREIRKQTIVLFTHGEDLGNMKIDEFIQNADQYLQQVVKDCEGRYHVFRNKIKNPHQVIELMGQIIHLTKNYEMCKDFKKWNKLHAIEGNVCPII